MFKKLFEGMAADENIIKLNITDMANDYPDVDYNELRDRLTDAGATVDGQVGNGTIHEGDNDDMNVYMLVSGVDMNTVETTVDDVVSEYEDVSDIDVQDYVVSDTITGVDDDDIDIDDDIDMDDDIDVVDDIDDDDDDIDIDDEDIVEAVKKATSKILHENRSSRMKRRINNSRRNDRFFVNGRLNEKSTMNIKKGCCHGKSRRVNLLESLKANDDKNQEKLDKSINSIKDIIDSVKGHSIGAQEVKDAFAKLKKEQKALSKIEKNDKGDKFALTDVSGVTGALKKMKEADPSQAKDIDKFQKSLKESVYTALKLKKHSLHGKTSVNGELLESMSNKQVNALYKKVLLIKNKLVTKLSNSLNESVNTKNSIKNELNKISKLTTILDEENTYRLYATKYGFINEDDNSVDDNNSGGDFSEEDLANMFGTQDNVDANNNEEKPEDTENSEDTEKSEDTEEVELARIVITMQDKDAAEDLKTSCINAGIPEDAIEISEDTDDDSEEDSEENTSEEDKPEEEGTEDKEANEGVKYSNLRRLFEDDETEQSDDTDNSEESDDSEDTKESDESTDTHVKFILIDTDYALQLSKVLDDVYGITKEEFEDMIGGEIVSDDDEDNDETDDTSTNDKENASDTDNNTEEDTIDPSELFKGM